MLPINTLISLFPYGTRPQERFEENADIVAVAMRAGGADSFPEYFHIARDLPEETELQVHEEAVRNKEHTLAVKALTFSIPAFEEWWESCRFSRNVEQHTLLENTRSGGACSLARLTLHRFPSL